MKISIPVYNKQSKQICSLTKKQDAQEIHDKGQFVPTQCSKRVLEGGVLAKSTFEACENATASS